MSVTLTEKRALLYLVQRVRSGMRGRSSPRQWWLAIDLLPPAADWGPRNLQSLADIAESMAHEQL